MWGCRWLRVIGYDVNVDKIKKLSRNNEGNIEFTSDPANIRETDPRGCPKRKNEKRHQFPP